MQLEHTFKAVNGSIDQAEQGILMIMGSLGKLLVSVPLRFSAAASYIQMSTGDYLPTEQLDLKGHLHKYTRRLESVSVVLLYKCPHFLKQVVATGTLGGGVNL